MNPAHRLMAARRSSFSPTDIGWHSLFWASGGQMLARGYSDGASVGTWDNETSETDATESTNKPTWKASNTSYNNKPTVNFGTAESSVKLSATFGAGPSSPWSIVTIGNAANSGYNCFYDAVDSSHRCHLFRLLDGVTPRWQLYQGGATAGKAGTPDGSPHFFVAKHSTSGNDTLSLDGAAAIINEDTGSHSMNGICLGNYAVLPSYGLGGHLAFVGIYSGDITAHGSWSALKSWAASFYGLTIA